MIGAVVIDAVMGQDIEMRSPSGFLDPLRAALPIAGPGRDIEAGFAGLVRSPGLPGRRLLHFQTQTVGSFEIPPGIIGAAPSPFRLQRERDDRLRDMPPQDIGDQRFAESGL